MPIFTELTNAYQHYVHTSYTELHPKWTINVASTDSNSFTPSSKVTVFNAMVSKKKLKLLNKFLWSSVPNFIKIGEKCRKYGQNFIYAHK
jgi:hypothetical protein